MKLQNLALIFAAIVVPISLLLGYYVNAEVNTMKLQLSYDEILISATYDAIKAYQINTANNYYSIVNRSQRRDVEAAIATFMDSFAMSIGKSGYGESQIKPYVPAILFALYDGYYIYSPSLNDSNGNIEHYLKPYFTYTAHYDSRKKGHNNGKVIDVFISYTLDNYITVTGYVNGTYVNKAGYLAYNIMGTPLNSETLSEQLLFYTEAADGTVTPRYETCKYIYNGGEKKYIDSSGKWFIYRNGTKQYVTLPRITSYPEDKNAIDYRIKANEFTEWVQSNLDVLAIEDLVLDPEMETRNKDEIYNYGNNTKLFTGNIETENSVFNTHKRDIMKMSIKENLTAAITNYNAHSGALGTNKFYQMPDLSETEWDQITKNICTISFVQGIPIGFKTYNNYAIINNTRNENYVDKDSLVFVNGPNSEYHKIDCPYLGNYNIIGYRKIDFETSAVELKLASGRKNYYYFKHTNLPCYYCIVGRNYVPAASTVNKLKALNQALARERQILHY